MLMGSPPLPWIIIPNATIDYLKGTASSLVPTEPSSQPQPASPSVETQPSQALTEPVQPVQSVELCRLIHQLAPVVYEPEMGGGKADGILGQYASQY